jgi:tetraacyldisaccharide 4'-kinase
MNADTEHSVKRVMSGEARGIGASLLRGILRFFEPFYALATRISNGMYDHGIKKVHRLERPVVSVGNITTGGTGKTPAVQWIARKLLAAGHRPACLLRGYTVGNATKSDEATLLEQSLRIPVRTNPDRVSAGRELIAEHPEIDVILLDDGFQHRRVHRDLDLVLIDATNPFGYGHVLPRGMLREPRSGLRRAHVLILTRSDLASAQGLTQIEHTLRRYNQSAPILRCRHKITALVNCDDILRIEDLRGRRIFSFCGVGNPTGFHQDLCNAGAVDPGHRWFGDHHNYSREEIDILTERAREADAEMMVTTEKDWVKIEPLLSGASSIPIWRAQLELVFDEASANELMSRIFALMAQPESSPARSAVEAVDERSAR